MALNSRGSVDPRWLTHFQRIGRGLQLASVEIYNPASGSQAYNAETNSWDGAATNLYTGRARVQPVGASGEAGDAYNPTLFQTVKVQISYNKNTLTGGINPMPDIRPNDRMRVTASPYNESLTKFIYVVTSVLNSSNSWERTLICRVDIELDPTVV